jgi:hypothetical protein
MQGSEGGGVKSMVLTTGAAFRPLIVRAMTLLLKIVARLLVTTTTLALPAAVFCCRPIFKPQDLVGYLPAAT